MLRMASDGAPLTPAQYIRSVRGPFRRKHVSSWIYGLVGGLLVGSLAACGQQEEKGREGGAPRGGRGPGAQVEAALPVKTVPVIRGEITSYVETHARLEARRWVEVVSRVQGLAEVLRTEEGDQVLAGQILLNLEK